MKIGAIIQARTTSTRLPKKVLKELPHDGRISVLEQVIRRLKKSIAIREIIIATTKNPQDDEIVKIARKMDVKIFRGSENDVLSRYYWAAKENQLDIIVRVTSDCPCIDPNIVDSIINEHLNSNADYTSSALSYSFPMGLDAEVLNSEILEKLFFEANDDFEREHVTPYIYKTKPEKFNIKILTANENLFAPDIRITLDTEEDYALLCAIYDYLYKKNEFFNAEEIISLFNEKPWLKLINKKILQKKIFNNVNDELMEAIKILDLQDLCRAKRVVENNLQDLY